MSFWQTMLSFYVEKAKFVRYFCEKLLNRVWLQFWIWNRNRNFPKVGTGTTKDDGSTILPVCLCNGLISARLEKK
jgi:hypothetical protein